MKHWSWWEYTYRAIAAAIVCLGIYGILTNSVKSQEKPFKIDPVTLEIVKIEHDPGGVVEKYVDLVDKYIKDGTKVELVGNCWSACTLLTKLVETDQFCVHPSASLHFHAPHTRKQFSLEFVSLSPEAYQNWYLQQYPNKLHMLLANRGGLTKDWFHMFGKDLKYVAPYCGEEE